MARSKLATVPLLISILNLTVGQECQVAVQNGNIVGMIAETANPSQNICSYLGVPFAAPPVGPLRFQSPVPASPWSGTLNATKHPNWCPQGNDTMFPKPPDTVISEDCLYLNVFQPLVDNITNANLPVMIFIHGGGFITGSADAYTPGRLLANGDIILVVIQYRLGILGFLSTGDLVSPGNNGLKDQALAIKWVNENIAAFGGNPNQVTVFGESSGGASAMYQILTPKNQGLIHGMIAQSGTALSFWAIDRAPSITASLIATLLGCPSSSSEMLVSCMRNVSWERFIQVPLNPLPVVEPYHDDAFISSEPLDIMNSGNVSQIPAVVGANKHDASFILATIYTTEIGPLGLDKNPDFMRNQLMPHLLRFLKNDEEKANRAVSSSLEMTYLSGVNRSNWDESMPGLVDVAMWTEKRDMLLLVNSGLLITTQKELALQSIIRRSYGQISYVPTRVYASVYKAPALHAAEILSRHGSNVYLYSFEHHSNLSFSDMSSGPNPPPVKFGIGHADELFYLFDFGVELSADDLNFSKLFVGMWTNFAKFGDPTPTNDKDNVTNERWLPYEAKTESFMKLNITPTRLVDYHSSWRPNGFDWN